MSDVLRTFFGTRLLSNTALIGSRCLLALTVIAYATGCRDEDRLLTAKCDVRGDVFTVTFPLEDASSATVGSFNRRHDELGTMFRVVPGDAQNSAAWTLTHQLRDNVISESYAVYWFSKAVHTDLKAYVDADAGSVTESSRAKIESILSAATRIGIGDVYRRTINGVLDTINNNPVVLDALRSAAPQERYLVVSSIALAKGAFLLYDTSAQRPYTRPFVAVQTLRIGNTYYHVNFSCPPLEDISLKSEASARC